jgi:peptidoglycan LD-endopeptidase LytH
VRVPARQSQEPPTGRLEAKNQALNRLLVMGRPQLMLAAGVVLILAELWLLSSQRPGASRNALRDAAPAGGALNGSRPAEAAGDPIVFSETGLFVIGARAPSGVVMPVAGVRLGDLVNSFGAPRSDGRRHIGIDIPAPTGTPLMAVVDGWIVALSYNEAGGRGFHLRDRSGQFLMYYAHLDRYADGLYAGMAVRQGELLGYVGSTGNAAMPHLHFEVGRVRVPDALLVEPINPYAFLRGDIPLSDRAAPR